MYFWNQFSNWSTVKTIIELFILIQIEYMEKGSQFMKISQNGEIVLDESVLNANTQSMNSSYFSNQHCHCLLQNPLYHHLTKQTKKVDKLTAQNQKLSFENTQLENDVKKLQNQLKQLAQENKQKIEHLKKRHREQQQHAERLYNEKLANKDKFIHELQNKLVGMNESKSQLFAQYLQAMKLADDSKEVAQYHQKIDQLNESICKMLEKLQSKNKQIAQKSERIQELELTNKQITHQFEQLQNNSNDILLKYQQYEKKLREKQHQLKKVNERSNQSLSHADFLLQEEKKTKEKIIQQLNNLHQLQISRYEKKITALQNALPTKDLIKGIQRKFQRQQAKNARLEKQYNETQQKFKSSIDEQDQRIDRLLKQIENLKNEKKGIKDTYEQQKQSFTLKNEKMQAFFNQNLAIIQKKNQEMAIKYNQTQRKNYILQQQKAQLQRRILKMQNQFQNKYRAIIRQSATQQQNLNQQILQLSKQKKDLGRILQDHQDQNIVFKNKLQNYTTMLMKKQIEKNNQLQYQKQNYNEKIAQLMKKLKEQQSKNIKLKELLHLHEQNKNVQIQNIRSLEDRHKNQLIAYQNHLRLYEGTLNELRKQKQYLESTKDQWKNKYQQLMEIKNLINSNYEQDCSLWKNKLKVLEDMINVSHLPNNYK